MKNIYKKILKWLSGRSVPLEQGRLLYNAARCYHCGDVCVSRSRHDYVRCLCKSVAVDGGLDYQRVVGYPENYENLAVYSHEPFERIRQFVEWGGRGRYGDQPLVYVKLKAMSDTHLANLLAYLKKDHFFTDLILKEQKYRLDHKIGVED
jgi:hypothetical protein